MKKYLFRLKKIKSKKSQGVFDMSFNMIFSIILIVFFIVAAFVALRYFFNYQKCTSVGLFLDDFKLEVNKAFNSEKASYTFNSTLPSSVEYVCIFNSSLGLKNATKTESEIYDYIKTRETTEARKNIYIYAPSTTLCIKWKEIPNLKASRNPQCYQIVNGKVSIKLEREFKNAYVSVN